MSSSRKYITPEEMAIASRKATAEGMRQLAKALNDQENNRNDSDSDDDDNVFISPKKSTSMMPMSIPTRHVEAMSKSAADIDKLETRLRFMKLDLSNFQVALDEEKTKVEKLTSNLDAYKNINTELAFIKSAISRATNQNQNLSKSQLEDKLKAFTDETNKHIALCQGAINTLTEHDEIKSSLTRILIAERKKIIQSEIEMNRSILITHIKDTVMKAVTLTVLFSLIIMLFSALF